MREILYNLLHKCVTLGCGYFYSSASSKTSTYTLQIILHHPFPLLIYRQSHSYWERRKKHTFPQQLSSVCHEISAVCLWQLSSLSFQVTGVCYQVLFTGVLHVETNTYFCSEGSAKVEKPTMTGSVSSVLSIVICSMPVRLGPDRPIKPHYKLKWCLTGSLLCFQGNPPGIYGWWAETEAGLLHILSVTDDQSSNLITAEGAWRRGGRTDSLGAVRVTMGHLSFCLPCDDVTWAL